jgi:recombination protein RecA
MANKTAGKKPRGSDDFTSELIKSLNKDHGSRIAYNLSVDESPTHVKAWVSTGIRQLDYIVSNRKDGGLPAGRIVEIFGPPSIGKSHIAYQIARSTQIMGGIVVYIDTENGTSVENLGLLGIDVSRRFVFIETACTEQVFEVAESTIMKARGLNKDVPITIIWDSVAASSPKAELVGDYDKDSIGLQARAISKGMRKITQVIGSTNTLFVALNQTRTKIGVMYGDPTTTPGGMALPFHSSTRIKLGAGSPIKNKDGEVVGINVWAKTIKNKVAPPFRTCHFEIHFGVGVKEHEQITDLLRSSPDVSADGKIYSVEGAGAWKTLTVSDEKSGDVSVEKKFTKSGMEDLLRDPQYLPYIQTMLENILVKKFDGNPDFDTNSYEEVRAVAMDIAESDLK